MRQRLEASQELQQEAAAALVAISNQMVQGAVSFFAGCTRSSGPSTLLHPEAATHISGITCTCRMLLLNTHEP